MTRGGGRVSVRRSVQAVSGSVIRQRLRVGSRAVIPSPRHELDAPETRFCGPCSVRTVSVSSTSRRKSLTVVSAQPLYRSRLLDITICQSRVVSADMD
jgi:hypothetical protein